MPLFLNITPHRIFPEQAIYLTSLATESASMSICLDSIDTRKLTPQKLDYIYYGINENGHLSCRVFNPFTGNPEQYKVLLGKGIADRVQLLVAQDLQCRYPPEQIVIHMYPSSYREVQLRRLGIQPGTLYNLGDYVEIIRRNVHL